MLDNGYTMPFLKHSILPILLSLLTFFCLVFSSSFIIQLLAFSATIITWGRQNYLIKPISGQNIKDVEVSNNYKDLCEFNTQLQEVIDRETSQVSEDIVRLQKLVSDSTKMLQKSFATISEKTKQQSELMLKFTDDTGLEKSEQANLAGNNMKTQAVELASVDFDNSQLEPAIANVSIIQEEVNSAIMALQFEDIVIQLSAHINRRIDHINSASSIAKTLSHSKNTGNELKSAIEQLRHLNQSFESERLSKIVRQNSLNEGDIDLF